MACYRRGLGKTTIFCDIVKSASLRNRKCLIVVKGRKLVDQASKRLHREGVEHGVMMANHWNYRPNLPIQVCSIDTLVARNIRPEADLIIIDEAHLFASGTKGAQLIQNYKCFIVAVTATPYLPRGLRHLADAVVHPINMMGLIEQGYLTNFRYFCPEIPDVSSVEIREGDYAAGQLEEVMIDGQLTGRVVDHWLELAKGRSTICFCVTIKHSKFVAEQFQRRGVRAEHCDADTSDEEREAIIRRLESGETEVVCNVGILCTGVDIPSLGAVIMARPTKSKNLFTQQAGRGTRPIYADGFDLETMEGRLQAISASLKPNCILLDHAGNITEHDLPTDEPDVDLDGNVKKVKRLTKICPECYVAFRGSNCPDCGKLIDDAPEDPAVILEESNAKLRELLGDDLDVVKRAFKKLKKEARDKGRKPLWASHQLVNRFGLERARPCLSEAFIGRYEQNLKPFRDSKMIPTKKEGLPVFRVLSRANGPGVD